MATILLVEDNETNRNMLSRRLERRGFVVQLAADAEEAMAMLGRAKPDLILMDISLPGMDGHQLTRELKADPATAAIPVIALTAHAMAADRASALEAGCDEYDTKPIEMPRLLEKIDALLAGGAA